MTSDLSYDPFDLAVRTDPYPYYRRLRSEAPAYFVESHGFWVLSRRDDVFRALHDWETFSSADGIAIERIPLQLMIGSDPPYHTRLRRIVQRQFTPRAAAAWEPRIVELCDELVADFLKRNDEGDADLARDVATPLPVMVIAEVLGIPTADRDRFKQWSEEVVYLIGGAIDPALQSASLSAALELAQYFSAIIDERRKNPDGNDLISLFIRAGGDGDEALTHEEIITHCILFLLGGNETTTNLIGNAFRALLARRDAEHRVRQDASLVAPMLEEVLRWDAPVQGLFRTTRSPVDIDGVTIPEGARVQLLYGSANRDERHYHAADEFDIDRNSRDHFAFGGGIHLCIGAPLARLEALHAVRTILERTSAMELREEPQMNFNILVRGPRTLPVSFDNVPASVNA